MTIFSRKAGACVLAAGILVSFWGLDNVNALTLNGKISYYDGVGGLGSDGKILGEHDCAVDDSLNNQVPKGTMIFVKNNSNGKTDTVYKWDYGNFPSGVVLDVMRSVYQNLGGSISSGYITNATVTIFN